MGESVSQKSRRLVFLGSWRGNSGSSCWVSASSSGLARTLFSTKRAAQKGQSLVGKVLGPEKSPSIDLDAAPHWREIENRAALIWKGGVGGGR